MVAKIIIWQQNGTSSLGTGSSGHYSQLLVSSHCATVCQLFIVTMGLLAAIVSAPCQLFIVASCYSLCAVLALHSHFSLLRYEYTVASCFSYETCRPSHCHYASTVIPVASSLLLWDGSYIDAIAITMYAGIQVAGSLSLVSQYPRSYQLVTMGGGSSQLLLRSCLSAFTLPQFQYASSWQLVAMQRQLIASSCGGWQLVAPPLLPVCLPLVVWWALLLHLLQHLTDRPPIHHRTHLTKQTKNV